MGWMLLLPLSLTWTLLSAPDVDSPSGKEELFRSVIEAVPGYQDFLTVDELHQSILDLGEAATADQPARRRSRACWTRAGQSSNSKPPRPRRIWTIR